MKLLPALLALALVPSLRAADAYPRKELLVEPAAIAKPEDAKKFIILDARSIDKYDAGHVPTATWVDHAQWAKDFLDDPKAEKWSSNIGGKGIASETKVIVYDDAMGKDAARIWWLLRYWGVKDVALLNGGWQYWEKSKSPVKNDVRHWPKRVEFKAVAQPERLATKDALLKSLAENQWQIVDARSEKEFCGIDAMKNKKAGAIPGAKQLEWSDLLDKDTQRFKPPAELAKLFEAAGIKLDQPVATHCQGGGRASVMAFGLELMGAKDVRNYYRSWSEWGNAEDTPVVKPEPKKK